MSNIYYNPEDFGLETIGEFDWYEESYEFDITAVWKSKRGEYWIGNDSGCSCPSPFEDFRDINDLDGPYKKSELKKRLNYMVTERDYYGRPEAEIRSDISAILDRIK
jgi:hypothetical protein